MSHILITPSSEQLATELFDNLVKQVIEPLRLVLKYLIESLCALIILKHLLLNKFQILISPLSAPLTICSFDNIKRD